MHPNPNPNLEDMTPFEAPAAFNPSPNPNPNPHPHPNPNPNPSSNSNSNPNQVPAAFNVSAPIQPARDLPALSELPHRTAALVAEVGPLILTLTLP